jgi:hypothetical protein
MSTVTLAKWARIRIEREPWGPSDDHDPHREQRSIYLGTATSLDPCGRYHHMLSPNGSTKRCEAYWESLERQLEKRGLSLTSGDGDALDQYAVEMRDIEDRTNDVESEYAESGEIRTQAAYATERGREWHSKREVND